MLFTRVIGSFFRDMKHVHCSTACVKGHCMSATIPIFSEIILIWISPAIMNDWSTIAMAPDISFTKHNSLPWSSMMLSIVASTTPYDGFRKVMCWIETNIALIVALSPCRLCMIFYSYAMSHHFEIYTKFFFVLFRTFFVSVAWKLLTCCELKCNLSGLVDASIDYRKYICGLCYIATFNRIKVCP